MEVEADAEPLAQLHLAPGPAIRVAIGLDDAAHGAALGHAASDEPLDAVPGHEIEATLGRALDRLPALDGMDRPGYQREVLQIVPAGGDPRRDGVVLALVGERGVVERLEDDVDLLLEELAIGRLVEERSAEGVDLAGMVPTPDAEPHAAAREHVDGGEVLRQTQRMPHR